MFERFDPPLTPNPGPDDLAATKARWAAHRRRIVLAVSGTSAVVVVALAALLAPTFRSGNHEQNLASTGRSTTTQPAPATTEAPTTSTTARRPPVATTSPPTTVRPGTRVETYSPWTSARKLAPGLAVRDQISGTSCDMQSAFEVGNQYAWRCNQADGQFYDPCFAPPLQSDVTTVACVDDPWSAVTLMKLSQPLANPSWGTATAQLDHPWAMLLANGQRCALIEGTGTQIGQTVFNYGCAPGHGTYPDRKTEPWTIRYSAGESGPITSVAVKTAWT